MRKVYAAVGMLLSLVLVLAGCGGSAETTGAQKSPENVAKAEPAKQEAPKTMTPVKLAPGPDGTIAYMSAFVAEGIGSWKNNGLDVTIMPTDGGNAASKALMSGEADFALLAADLVVKNRVTGADLVIVGYLTRYPGQVFIVQKNLEGKVKSIKDLKGMKVGVSSIGGGTHGTVLAFLEKNGMKADDVEVVAAKDKLVEMWNKGEVAAANHVSPVVDQLLQENKAFILYDLRAEKDTHYLYDGSDAPLAAIVTRQDVVDQKPELVTNFLRGMLEANKFISTSTPEQIMAKMPDRYTKTYDAKLYATVIKSNTAQLTLDLKVDQSGINTLIKSMRNLKQIPGDAQIDLAKLVNLSFVDKAAKK